MNWRPLPRPCSSHRHLSPILTAIFVILHYNSACPYPSQYPPPERGLPSKRFPGVQNTQILLVLINPVPAQFQYWHIFPSLYRQTNRDKSCLQDVDTYGCCSYWNYRVEMSGYDILEATIKPPKTWKEHWKMGEVGKTYSYLFAQYTTADLSTSSQLILA